MAWNPVITNIVTTPSLTTTLSNYTTLNKHDDDLVLKLDKAGGFATDLRLNGAMSTPDSAVSRSYVDETIGPLNSSLASKANIDNPTLTGTVNVPTGTTSTSAVNLSQLQLYLPLTGGTVTGQIKSSLTPTATSDLTNKSYVDGLVETKTSAAYVDDAVNNLESEIVANFMPLLGGVFTGSVSGPTPGPTSNGNELATTSFVVTAIENAVGSGLFATDASVDSKLELMTPKVGAQLLSPRVLTAEDPGDKSDLIASHAFVHRVFETYVEQAVRDILAQGDN